MLIKYSSTASGHVITDILARDIEEICDVEQRQPSRTVNPLPAWVAGYAASQISAACECVVGRGPAKKLKAAPREVAMMLLLLLNQLLHHQWKTNGEREEGIDSGKHAVQLWRRYKWSWPEIRSLPGRSRRSWFHVGKISVLVDAKDGYVRFLLVDVN